MIFGGSVAVGHKVAQGGVTIVTDGLVETDWSGQAVQFGVGLVECLAVA
jgi:hypothetical protein